MADVAVVMGSMNDSDIMSGAVEILKEFGVTHEVMVISAHRTPAYMFDFASNAEKKFRVIIAGAGGAAHLPGMIASMTILPVFGVPVAVGTLGGVDSLLSIAQMPKGVPVGTLAIGAAANAALLAIRVLALNDERLRDGLHEYRSKLEKKVLAQRQIT